MTKFLRLSIAMIVCCFALSMSAQQMPPIPVDKDVRIGQLPNGLTYYIRHNETPKGQADFYIAQKVGSVLEEDNQRGLAHFLEHMCFNGTTHFPGTALRDWLESVGVKFGMDLNAYTSIDQTVYNIASVPVARQSVQDSCLLILHDWACDLTLDPKEIDSERGVIHEEWRRSMMGQMRILEKLLPVMYPNSRYGYRLPIGTMEVVDNFKPEVLRAYYETWYRPDQQGIIVVGDIDVDYIEGKIKEIFSPIEMPKDAKERVYFEVEDTPGTIYAIGSDPEQTVSVCEMFFKTDATPKEMKGSMEYLLMQYMVNMVETMLDQRLTDLGNTPDAPFAQAGVGYGEYFLSKTKEALALTAVPKGGDPVPALEAAYRELLRATKFGFTIGEYERARAEYLSRLEKTYNGRDKRDNGVFVNQYVNNFIDNEPMPSIEDHYQMMTQIANMIPVEAINSILPQIVTNDNRVLLSLNPENGDYKIPTEKEFADAFAKVDAEELEPYKDTMKEEPLIPALPTPGKVVSEADDAQWGAKVLTLSNGVKVYVKTTDLKKDEILFAAVAVGGTSVVPESQANNLVAMPYYMSNSGLGTYNNTDLQKYTQGKQASVYLSGSDYNRQLQGSSTVKDLPTLMELIYMTFTDYTITPEDFESTKNRFVSLLANQESDPQFIFGKLVNEAFYESAASQQISSEILQNADRQAIVDIARSAVQNAADFTFFFVGDVTVEQLKPLLEQYIATLPADAAKATTTYEPNPAREVKPGTQVDTAKTKMETPQTWCYIYLEGSMPYTAKNRYIASAVSQILTNRLLKSIREEKGATYSISSSGSMARQGKYNTTLEIPFPMKPEMKDEVLAEIKTLIEGMATNVTAEELNPIKEFLVKNLEEGKDKNGTWLGHMTGTQLNGVDIFNGGVDVVNSITVNDVMNFCKEFLAQGNCRTFLLDPEE